MSEEKIKIIEDMVKLAGRWLQWMDDHGKPLSQSSLGNPFIHLAEESYHAAVKFRPDQILWSPIPPPQGTECLYKHWTRDGILLYIGVTCHADRRQREHAANSHWFRDVDQITYQVFDTRQLAEAAEETSIQAEHPRHNIAKAIPQ